MNNYFNLFIRCNVGYPYYRWQHNSHTSDQHIITFFDIYHNVTHTVLLTEKNIQGNFDHKSTHRNRYTHKNIRTKWPKERSAYSLQEP